MIESSIHLIRAASEKEFEDGKILFQQYAQSLHFDLGFQQFDKELDTIATKYNTPEGALILAYDAEKPIACIAVRRLEEQVAELKRMFVNPAYRGRQLGQRLLAEALAEAKNLQYWSIRLDTVPDMQSAIKLYQAFGFVEIEPYRYNPMPGAIYMNKVL